MSVKNVAIVLGVVIFGADICWWHNLIVLQHHIIEIDDDDDDDIGYNVLIDLSFQKP